MDNESMKDVCAKFPHHNYDKERKTKEEWEEVCRTFPEEANLDSLLIKVIEHEDVNNAYNALRKITNKDNAVGALSVILAERLERLVSKVILTERLERLISKK